MVLFGSCKNYELLWIDPYSGDQYEFQGKKIIKEENRYESYMLTADSGRWQMYMKVSKKWIEEQRKNQ